MRKPNKRKHLERFSKKILIHILKMAGNQSVLVLLKFQSLEKTPKSLILNNWTMINKTNHHEVKLSGFHLKNMAPCVWI